MKAPRLPLGSRAVLVSAVALVVAPITAILVSAPPSAALTVFHVTTSIDSGAGSFRQALLDASAADDDEIEVDFDAGLTVSIIGAELVFDPAGGTALLTINGNGSTVVRSANADRILEDQSTGPLTINDLTMTGGDLIAIAGQGGSIFGHGSVTVNNSTIDGSIDAGGVGGGVGQGGAIYSDGAIAISSSTINGDVDAHAFGPGAGGVAQGGAVGAEGDIAITSSTLTGSVDAHADAAPAGIAVGGAVWTDGAITATGSSFSGTANSNSSGSSSGVAQGGAIFATASASLADTNVAGSSVSSVGVLGNLAQGGGVWTNGIATLVRSTIEGASAEGTDATGSAQGGGIGFTRAGTFTNSTIVGNTASGANSAGGGIFDANGDVALVYTNVVGNSVSAGANIDGAGPRGESADVHSERVGSLAAFGSVVVQPAGGGTNCAGFPAFASTGHNFSDDTTCGFTDPTDNAVVGNDALLGPPANNGGMVATQLPLAGSPLIDAIPNAECQSGPAGGITTDERSLPRPEQAAGPCDIGAVEVQLPPPPPPGPPGPTPTPTPSPAPIPGLVAIPPHFTG